MVFGCWCVVFGDWCKFVDDVLCLVCSMRMCMVVGVLCLVDGVLYAGCAVFIGVWGWCMVHGGCRHMVYGVKEIYKRNEKWCLKIPKCAVCCLSNLVKQCRRSLVDSQR